MPVAGLVRSLALSLMTKIRSMMKTRPLLFLPFVLLSACASQTDLSYVQGQVSQLKEESQVIKTQSAGSYSEITQYREEVATLKGGVSELRHDHSETLKRLDVEDSLLVKKNIELEKRLARLEKYLDIMDTASKTPENIVTPPPPPPSPPSAGAKSPARPAAAPPANTKSRLKAPEAVAPSPSAAPAIVELPVPAAVPVPTTATAPVEVSASALAPPPVEVPAPAVVPEPIEAKSSAPVETPVMAPVVAPPTPDLSVKVEPTSPASASAPVKDVSADRFDEAKVRTVGPATAEIPATAVIQEPVTAKSKPPATEAFAVKSRPDAPIAAEATVPAPLSNQAIVPEKTEAQTLTVSQEPVQSKAKSANRTSTAKSRPSAPAVVEPQVAVAAPAEVIAPVTPELPAVAPAKTEAPKPLTAKGPAPAKVKPSYRSWAEKSRAASPAMAETPAPEVVPVSTSAPARTEVQLPSAVTKPVADPAKSETPVPAWAKGKTIAEARADKKRAEVTPAAEEAPAPVVAPARSAAPAKSEAPVPAWARGKTIADARAAKKRAEVAPAAEEAPAPVVAAVPVATPAKSEPPVYNGEEALIRDGLAKMEVSDYSGARANFTSYMAQNPKSPQVGDAQFYIAESYFNEKWYEKAILEYQVVIAKYTKNSKRPASLYKQALSFEKIDDQVNANARFKDVIRNYPLSPEAKLAKKKLQ